MEIKIDYSPWSVKLSGDGALIVFTITHREGISSKEKPANSMELWTKEAELLAKCLLLFTEQKKILNQK